ncbi:MAG: holo-ACP synthase [Actinomycetales bacterium]|nr:holo-ACP synthase [Actinomycetales bacterium]
MPQAVESRPSVVRPATGPVRVPEGRSARAVPRVGVDLADPAEIAASIARFGPRYLDRVFTPAERAHTGDAPERLAARFAAKEAVIKLLRLPADTAVVYREVEIVADAAGAPLVHLAPRLEALAAAQGLGPIAVSLSHERGLAAATALALASDPSRAAGPAPALASESAPRPTRGGRR